MILKTKTMGITFSFQTEVPMFTVFCRHHLLARKTEELRDSETSALAILS